MVPQRRVGGQRLDGKDVERRAAQRAAVEGIKLTTHDPAGAIDQVLNAMDGGSRELELSRLNTAIRENILTDEVKRDGLGDISRNRFEASIVQIGEDFKFGKQPALADIFDSSFLPSAQDRTAD